MSLYTLSTTPCTAFGALLRRVREAQEITQFGLARRTMYDTSFISRLESGSRNPHRETVLRLADALQVDAATRDRMLRAAGMISVADYREHVEQEAL